MLLKFWTGVEWLARAVLCALLSTMVIVCLGQVISRYVFNDPLTWSEELARFLFVWVGYLSAWFAWTKRAHIALDAVTYLRVPALERACGRIVEALVLVYCGWTLYACLGFLRLTSNQPSAVLDVPMSTVYAGYAAMCVLIIGDILIGWAYGPRQPSPAVPQE
ncbi:TRAP transporter small permease [Ancylobacter rudongensis]|uniref:TRAP transporter small permease protein n=1 Tax=Ancylobacter rudongensis TaxID=177413 RepID=A0A1G4RE57_9HYPH|nr:TRAP transporter small permease [Ancylobacter rudongensis]SCW55158.1 TRAP-type C4-dicarboxylate transport system, small permease component [Ancylobacter rudongensis]